MTLAAALAALSAATSCQDVHHHGYLGVGIRPRGIGCDTADGIVRHVIDHGNAGFHQMTCTWSYLPKNVTEWSCSRYVHGAKVGVTFGVRPASRR